MLIPFGEKNGKYFDVTEVDGGRDCGCICPSCKQRLVAKKGPNPDKMIHHFSHDRQSKSESSERIECEYSFCVVARLVIKQALTEVKEFELTMPAWSLTLHAKDSHGITCTANGMVTKACTLTINDFEIEPQGEYRDFDVICRLGRYPIAVHFSYKGRPVYIPDDETQVSILDIDLEYLKPLYDSFDDSEYDSFKALVIDYALSSGNRQWLSHARKSEREKVLNSKLARLVASSYTRV